MELWPAHSGKSAKATWPAAVGRRPDAGLCGPGARPSAPHSSELPSASCLYQRVCPALAALALCRRRLRPGRRRLPRQLCPSCVLQVCARHARHCAQPPCRGLRDQKTGRLCTACCARHARRLRVTLLNAGTCATGRRWQPLPTPRPAAAPPPATIACSRCWPAAARRWCSGGWRRGARTRWGAGARGLEERASEAAGPGQGRRLRLAGGCAAARVCCKHKGQGTFSLCFAKINSSFPFLIKC